MDPTDADDAAPVVTHQVTIDNLSYGAEGVGRLPSGKVVFVPGAVPGDVVHVRVTDASAKGFSRGTLWSWVRPAPARVESACPHSDTCGGCQLWGLPPDHAWKLKARSALDTLTRVGRLTLPPDDRVHLHPSPSDHRYRRRLRLQVAPDGALGFFKPQSHDLQPISDCAVAAAPLIDAARALQPHLGGTGGGSLLLELDLDGPRVAALFQPRTLPPHAPSPAAFAAHLRDRLDPDGVVRGVRLLPFGPNPDPRDAYDVHTPTFRLRLPPDLTVTLDVGQFTQANAAVNALMIRHALDALDPASYPRLLDLYSGFGNFTFPLAQAGATVHALELSRAAIASGTHHAPLLLDRPSRARFTAHNLNRGLPRRLQQPPGAFDGVLLDPPRAGASRPLLKHLLALAPKRIVYVSCAPPTLARDLARLLRTGDYTLHRLHLLDMFPRTYHVEAIAVLDRRAA